MDGQELEELVFLEDRGESHPHPLDGPWLGSVSYLSHHLLCLISIELFLGKGLARHFENLVLELLKGVVDQSLVVTKSQDDMR